MVSELGRVQGYAQLHFHEHTANEVAIGFGNFNILTIESIITVRRLHAFMGKRILFTIVWAAAFLIVSAALLLLAWRIYFGIIGAPARRPSEDTIMWFGASVVVIPLLFGGVGAAFGIRGALPGTRRDADESN